LNPLAKGFANGDIEAELRDLFVRLYEETMSDAAAEINVYGAPHLGPLRLAQRSISADGLSVLNQMDEPRLRYLLKAWRFRNPRRGTHFLKTYLRILFGEVYEVNQLWQKKAAAYPTYLRTKAEMAVAGESESEFYLTSRLRVDLTTDQVPDRVASALRNTVPARFVLEIRLSQVASSELRTGGALTMVNFFTGSGTSA